MNKMDNLEKIFVDLAINERKIFIEQNGREPTEKEAERMAEMIMQQARIALVMLK